MHKTKILILTILFAVGNEICGMEINPPSDFPIDELVHESMQQPEQRFVIERKLSKFKDKHPQFKFGIGAMETLYDTPDPSIYYSSLKSSSFTRNTVFAAQLLIGAACSVIKCLSIAYPQNSVYAKSLIGLYIGKGVSWGLGTYIESSSGQPILDLMNAHNAGAESKMTLSNICSFVQGIETDKVIKITQSVLALIKDKELEEDDILRLSRLSDLIERMEKSAKPKDVLLTAGKSLSFLVGGLTGLAGVVKKMSVISFGLTLTSCSLDSIFDNISNVRREGEAMQKYASISEIVFLSEYLLNECEESV